MRLFQTEQYKAKFAHASKAEQALNLEMQAAFEKLYQGVTRMNDFLKTRNPEDVKEGAALAEAGFVGIRQCPGSRHGCGDVRLFSGSPLDDGHAGGDSVDRIKQ